MAIAAAKPATALAASSVAAAAEPAASVAAAAAAVASSTLTTLALAAAAPHCRPLRLHPRPYLRLHHVSHPLLILPSP